MPVDHHAAAPDVHQAGRADLGHDVRRDARLHRGCEFHDRRGRSRLDQGVQLDERRVVDEDALFRQHQLRLTNLERDAVTGRHEYGVVGVQHDRAG
jgi:hypothetical protein